MSRIANTEKNVQWSLINNIISSLLNFANRTVFIYTIGAMYLGVNGLFSNVLSLLSLTEMGVGTAINFSMYRPLANNDKEKIKSLMRFYKYAYRIISLTVFSIGLCILPFLDYLIKDGEDIKHKPFIFLIFLLGTVSSYLISYKQVLISADQKNYVIDNFNSITNILVFFIQFITLTFLRNYYIYLLINLVSGIIKNIILNIYITKKYSYLSDSNVKQLEVEEKNVIFNKIKALMYHKVGEVCIYQTDNIIISAFINVTTVGLISNYTLILNSLNKIVNSLFNTVTASLGNLLVTEDRSKAHSIYKVYNYFGFLFYGWMTVVLFFLITPFVQMWIGKDMIMLDSVVYLLVVNFFLTGMRIPLANIKTVAGVFEQDKWVPIAQAITNLIISIVGVRLWGIIGVYIGTFISSMFPNIYRPIVVYKEVFGTSAKLYFITYLKYITVLVVEVLIIRGFQNVFIIEVNNFITWIFYAIIISLFTCGMNILLFIKTEEWKYIWKLIKRIFGKKNKETNRS